MALYNSSDVRDTSELLTQTPPNFPESNYFLNQIQEKIDYDWDYRPNRKIIEIETQQGSNEYECIDVVVQTVKSDKGEPISDDWYRLVFRDCRRKNKVGTKYRFSYEFDPTEANVNKNIWLGMNQKTLTPTSSQVICRCNGSIGSIYTDENGTNMYHYEPIVQPTKANREGFDYNEVAINNDGTMTIVAQYNKYTKQYYVNERFILGEDSVYKVTNISKYESRTTFDPTDVGLIRINLAIDQIGDLDDLEKRIAYNGNTPEPKPKSDEGEYTFVIEEPSQLPDIIPLSGLVIKPSVLRAGQEAPSHITYELRLDGDGASGYNFNDYASFEQVSPEAYEYKITRKKTSMAFWVVVRFVAEVEDRQEPIYLEVRFSLRPF